MAQQTIPAVKALIFDADGNVLFLCQELESGEHVYELPGGKIEFGESPHQTLQRELHEELSIDEMTIHECVGMWWFIHPKQKDQICCTTYRVSLPDQTPLSFANALSHENIVSYTWLSKAAIISGDYTIHPTLKALIEGVRL